MTVCGASVCKLLCVNLVPRLFFVTSPCSLALSLLYVSWPSRCLTLKHKDAPACVEMLHMRAVKVLQALCASGSICQRAQTSPLLAAAASLWMSVAAPRSDVLRNTENNPTWQKNKTETDWMQIWWSFDVKHCTHSQIRFVETSGCGSSEQRWSLGLRVQYFGPEQYILISIPSALCVFLFFQNQKQQQQR